MKKHIYILAAMAALFTAACGNFKTASNGVKYRVIKSGDGEANADTTSLLFANYSIAIESTDSILKESYTANQPSYIPVFEPTMKTVLQTLVKGDSALLLINADSFFLNSFGQPRPEWIKAGDNIKFIITVNDIFSKEQMRAKEMEEIRSLSAKDSADFNAAVASMPNAIKTTNGVVYTEIKPGTGAGVKKGDKVKVLYKGTLLNGQVFDENLQNGIEVSVGLQQVIPGWDEMLSAMKLGQKVKAIIPWSLAYGRSGSGPIPPFSSLVFEMELIKIN